MKKILALFLLAALLLFSVESIHAGAGNRKATGGASHLLIPVGARGIAMGGANIAATYGLDAIFWNPAGVADSPTDVNVMFSHMSYIADIGVEYGAVSAKLGELGTVAFSIKALSIGEIDITTTQDPDGTGATFSPQMMVAGITFSRQLTDNIAIGLTANYISETLDRVSATGLGFNAGVIYKNLADVDGLSFGLAMKNFGPQMQYDGSGLYYEAEVDEFHRKPNYYKAESAPYDLPSTFELGFAYSPQLDKMNNLVISANFQNHNFASDEYKVGAEYSYNNMFFLRAGYTTAPEEDAENYLYGLTAGAGINYAVGSSSVRVDYTYRDVQYFDANHVFSVSFGF